MHIQRYPSQDLDSNPITFESRLSPRVQVLEKVGCRLGGKVVRCADHLAAMLHHPQQSIFALGADRRSASEASIGLEDLGNPEVRELRSGDELGTILPSPRSRWSMFKVVTGDGCHSTHSALFGLIPASLSTVPYSALKH